MNTLLESILFIDPGLCGTGWAYWQKLSTMAKTAAVPTGTGVIHSGEKDSWLSASFIITAKLTGLLPTLRPSAVVIEMPELWAGSSLSFASAMHRAQPGEPPDLFKLTYLVGGFGLTVAKMGFGNPILISPSEWKGQLSKDQVMDRIEDRLKTKYPDHTADAVGMGLAGMGKL